MLVHHPYDSFTTSVEPFVEQAASDPHVLAIKQTIYRTARPRERASCASLVKAAEQGKQVVALVELKARFDEQANIERARMLEEAGVHVVYGLVGLKTHAKILLVVRQESDGHPSLLPRRHRQLQPQDRHDSTRTSACSPPTPTSAPTSPSCSTTSPATATRSTTASCSSRPSHIRPALTERIERQAALGADGHITMKMNALVDPAHDRRALRGVQRGVPIDLVVRGICCLRPQVPGLSEHDPRPVDRRPVPRALAHLPVRRRSETAEYLIGSADLMPRNLDRRVEALTPVDDPRLRSRLAQVLDANLADDTLSWELAANGTWRKVPTVADASTQRRLQDRAISRAHFS